MASLTKMMTCYAVILLSEELGMGLHTTKIQVQRASAETPGTSAFLRTGDYLVLWDLLHGLMLPSGNDAAHCLATYFGTILGKKAHRYIGLDSLLREPDLDAPPRAPEIEAFIREMNLRAI